MKILIEVYSFGSVWGAEAFEERVLIEESELEDYLIKNYIHYVYTESAEAFKKFISGKLNFLYIRRYHYENDECPVGYHFERYNTKEEALEAAKKKYNRTIALIEDTYKGEE